MLCAGYRSGEKDACQVVEPPTPAPVSRPVGGAKHDLFLPGGLGRAPGLPGADGTLVPGRGGELGPRLRPSGLLRRLRSHHQTHRLDKTGDRQPLITGITGITRETRGQEATEEPSVHSFVQAFTL